MKKRYILFAMATAIMLVAATTANAQGSAKVKELRVTLTDWPDYVFSDAYRLMPLGEVEGYIAKNGHLPQMPSAAEVEAEGADLGEITRLLMQKVEELTLYVIDLRRQLDELKSKNKTIRL